MNHAEGKENRHVVPYVVVSRCKCMFQLQNHKAALAYCRLTCVSTASFEAMLACHDLVRVAIHDVKL